MKKLLIIAVVLFGTALFAKAQMLNVNYQMSVPFGDVKKYTDKTSFRGADIEYHYFLGDRFSVGAAIGWNVYYQDKGTQTGDFTFSGSDNIYTITGDNFRYINTVPMLAVGRYYFTDENVFARPFVGLGVGTSWTERRLEVGQFAAEISRWQFLVAPEVGVYFPISKQFAVNVGAKYNYATKAANGRVPEIQSLTFSVGLILMGVQ